MVPKSQLSTLALGAPEGGRELRGPGVTGIDAVISRATPTEPDSKPD